MVVRGGFFFRFLELEFLFFSFKVFVDLVRSDMFIRLLMQGFICSSLLIHWCIQKKQNPQSRHALNLHPFLIC